VSFNLKYFMYFFMVATHMKAKLGHSGPFIAGNGFVLCWGALYCSDF
jgi:hypothetical protein